MRNKKDYIEGLRDELESLKEDVEYFKAHPEEATEEIFRDLDEEIKEVQNEIDVNTLTEDEDGE